MTSIVNIKKKELNKRNISNFQEWNKKENTLYIGRNMNYYVKGALKSKWHNPFSAKKYGRDGCLIMFEKYIMSNKELMNSFDELKDKELGCWSVRRLVVVNNSRSVNQKRVMVIF